MFFKKATEIDKIFTVDLTLCSKCQIDAEDFVNYYCLLRKDEFKKKKNTFIEHSFVEKYFLPSYQIIRFYTLTGIRF